MQMQKFSLLNVNNPSQFVLFFEMRYKWMKYFTTTTAISSHLIKCNIFHIGFRINAYIFHVWFVYANTIDF